MQDDSIKPVRHPTKILRRPSTSGGKSKGSDADDSSATPSPSTSTFFMVREAPLQGEAAEHDSAKKRGLKRKTTLTENGTSDASVDEVRNRRKEAELERGKYHFKFLDPLILLLNLIF